MRRPVGRHEAEIEVKKSRFIAISAPLSDLGEIKAKVKEVWAEHPDATHVVHAAVVGPSGSLWSCSDDREPKNTAGRPALEVLKGSGLTDILVCVVRYFGGTLLGTGGLVKAYGDAVKEVLKDIPSEEIVERARFTIKADYASFDRLSRVLPSYDIASLSQEWAEGVTITGQLAVSEKERFQKDFEAATMGRCVLSW